MSTRRQTLTLLATATLAAGAGVAWYLGPGRPTVQPDAAAVRALWPLQLPRPDGSTLALATFRGKPLVVNFWATWCPPCVTELPELDQFHREMQAQGWQVLALAIDQPEAVKKFLSTRSLAMPVVTAGFEGTEIARSLGNTTGAMPFTVLIDARGQIAQRKLGATHLAELRSWAAGLK